ncbi:MAG: ABC transporter ATP-binding protein [Opitutales bacterium]|nr:ABC transporter ATP-binding protein [Opitutales bacterium]
MQQTQQNVEYSVVAEGLCKSYGAIKAIDNVSFKIAKGEILGFLGPNGAGKSTTMRILSGLMPATSGRAYVCGVSVANNPKLAQSHIGYMPENNPLPEDVRVSEYLKFRAAIKGLKGREIREAVDEVMEVCQLQRKASRKIIGNLSKGFKQRVGIADALLGKPEVVIMDEPTIGLDPHQIIAIRELIDSLRGKMSVVISSHILPEIELVCDRVMIINHGMVVASGAPENLRSEFLPVDTYKIAVSAELEQVKSVLAAAGLDFEVEQTSKKDAEGFALYALKTSRRGSFGDALIAEFAKHPNFRLREVYLSRPTLEDIFMAATRRSWEEKRESIFGAKRQEAKK